MHDDDPDDIPTPPATTPVPRFRLRSSSEVAQELVYLSTVLHLEARRFAPGRGPLAFASEALAVAPHHADDEVPRALLPLLASASTACSVALERLKAVGEPRVASIERVRARLQELAAMLDRR